jgi:hypothetical protein
VIFTETFSFFVLGLGQGRSDQQLISASWRPPCEEDFISRKASPAKVINTTWPTAEGLT